ncbi:MAG: tRNA pseudouridine(55) synthase TruB [Candidatus Nitrohelix vancouverensis]|uniref:tRNA pseudouridine synthase B n=1 Tax=Candidatus Nitrohelix vancouverensis TaxID=2705534 RepID=A0A7T0C4J6_9BACT|nr:MAG: tRNA pseudouridine(55) synthase TruB [Candidatus Nitrohelix vancouverensis]
MDCTLNKVVNLYKPAGPTSFDMVCKVKRILGVKKAGHIGTLDPDAEGMLPICLNRSTRIIPFLTAQLKVYEAQMTLGSATDTQDSTGKTIAEGSVEGISREQVLQVLNEFRGPQNQVPPMFSAKKKNGIPLYKLARNGITIERKAVPIHIHSIEMIGMEDNRVDFVVQCSSGTYIRTLCHDMGERLGCYAHMSRLVRTEVGIFNRDTSLTLENLQAAVDDGSISSKLFSQEEALQFLPAIQIKSDHAAAVGNGKALTRQSIESIAHPVETGQHYRVSDDAGLTLAVVESAITEEEYARLEPNEIAFKLKRVLM